MADRFFTTEPPRKPQGSYTITLLYLSIWQGGHHIVIKYLLSFLSSYEWPSFFGSSRSLSHFLHHDGIYTSLYLSLFEPVMCVCVCGGEGGGGGAGPCKDKIQFYFLLSICLRSVSFLVRPARRTERDRRKNFALLTAHYLIFLSLNFSFSKMVSLTTSKISWTTRGNRYKAPDQ